jgi:hypothetical protein
MKHVLNTLLVMSAMLLFIGCYTELATVERNDREYAFDSDTTSEGGATIINNNYYLDDSYRQSRLRVSFNYYYPSYSSWIGAYYNSYFNDYYWGMSYRPSWYFDPFYSYGYPYYGCVYPTPYYDPWYPYYHPIAYYPVYTPPIYVINPSVPGRTRDNGASRDQQTDVRTRPIPGSSAVPVAEAATPEVRPRNTDEAVSVGRNGRTPERAWWERVNAESGTRNTGEARPVDVTKEGRVPRDEASPSAPSSNTRPGTVREDRPIDRNKPNAPNVGSGTQERQPEARPVERPRRGEVRNSTPAVSSSPSGEARPVQRPRESSRPSYTPAPQSAPPQSTPPRSSGGSSGGGRKRD